MVRTIKAYLDAPMTRRMYWVLLVATAIPLYGILAALLYQVSK